MSRVAPANEIERERTEGGVPYPAGWIDRITGWVDRLPMPGRAVYLLAWLVVFAIETLIKWRDGAYPVGTIYPFHGVFTVSLFYVLALMDYLDRRAASALESARPLLKASESDYRRLQYEFTHLPSRPTLLASAAGVIWAAITIFATWPNMARERLATSLQAGIFDGLVFLLAWWAIGACVYHTIHQLRLVSHVYNRRARIDLYDLGPIYAFSGLTVRTAIGWLIFAYTWLIAAPEQLSQPVSVAIEIALTLMALVTFAWPLLGLHARLEQEKSRLLADVGQRVKGVSADLRRRLDAGDLNADSSTALNNAMTTLMAERELLAKIPTWPWKSGTIGTLGTALLLPFALWLIEQVLLRSLHP